MELEQIPLKIPPQAGSRWRGIQHGEFAHMLMEEALRRRFTYALHRTAISLDEKDIAMAFSMNHPGIRNVDGHTFYFGVMNSNAMRWRLRFFAGTWHNKMDRGFVSEEINIRDATLSHYKGMELGKIVRLVFSELFVAFDKVEDNINELKDRELTRTEVEKIIIHSGKMNNSRKGFVTWNRVPKILQEWDRAGFADINAPSSWRLLMCFSKFIKHCPPMFQMHQLAGMRKMIPTVHQHRLRFD